MNIKRGDIIMIQLHNDGSIQGGYRPCVIVQNDIGNKFSPTTIVVPLTKELKKTNLPTHEVVKREDANGLKLNSMGLCEQIITINKSSIIKKVGQVTNNMTMHNIMKACSISLGLA